MDNPPPPPPPQRSTGAISTAQVKGMDTDRTGRVELEEFYDVCKKIGCRQNGFPSGEEAIPDLGSRSYIVYARYCKIPDLFFSQKILILGS